MITLLLLFPNFEVRKLRFTVYRTAVVYNVQELTVFDGFQSESWKGKQIVSCILNAQRWIPWEQHQCTWPQRDTKHNPGKHVKHLLLCIGGNKKMSPQRADLELITVVLTVLKRLNSVLLHDTEPLITVLWPLGNRKGKNQTKQSITHKRRDQIRLPSHLGFWWVFFGLQAFMVHFNVDKWAN